MINIERIINIICVLFLILLFFENEFNSRIVAWIYLFAFIFWGIMITFYIVKWWKKRSQKY